MSQLFFLFFLVSSLPLFSKLNVKKKCPFFLLLFTRIHISKMEVWTIPGFEFDSVTNRNSFDSFFHLLQASWSNMLDLGYRQANE